MNKLIMNTIILQILVEYIFTIFPNKRKTFFSSNLRETKSSIS